MGTNSQENAVHCWGQEEESFGDVQAQLADAVVLGIGHQNPAQDSTQRTPRSWFDLALCLLMNVE